VAGAEEVEVSGAPVAVDAAFNAAVSVLNGGKLEGEGDRLLRRASEFRWVLGESPPIANWLGDGEGEREETAGEDEVN